MTIWDLDQVKVFERAVAKLDAIDVSDPEVAHSEADDILLDVLTQVIPTVSDAYVRVMNRAEWWASA